MSLRERNRRAAMRAIQSVAVRRFGADGFEAVTVEEIAAEGGVSPSTVYRYFSTKEELIVWDEQDAVVSAALERHLGTVPPLEALAVAFAEAYTLAPEEREALRARAALIDAVPALRAFQIARLDRERKALVAALARAYRRRAGELELDLVARIAIAALLAGFERWQSSRSSKSLATWIKEAFGAARGVK